MTERDAMQDLLQTSCSVLAGLRGLIRYVRLPGDPFLSKVETPYPKEASKGFKCKCGNLCNKPVHITIETRPRDYYGTVISETGHKKEAFIGSGTEIVKEELVCQRCATIHNGLIIPAKG